MPTLSPNETKTLEGAIARLAKDCAHKRSTFNISNTESQKSKNFDYYITISQACQALLIKAKSIFQTPEAFLNWCQNDCPFTLIPEVTQEIIPFAMTLESDDLTELGRWLSPALKIAHLEEDQHYSPLNRIRELYNQLSNNYAGLEGEKYREPAFYVREEFRDGLLHDFAYKRKVNHAIVNIIEDCLESPESASTWIKKIHDTCLTSPHTGQVVKDALRDRLMDEPVGGLSDLRDYALGQNIPTGVECSKRCSHLVDRFFYTRRLIDLVPDTSAILMNELYMRNAFIEEVVTYVQRAIDAVDNEYDRSGDLPDCQPNLQNFTTFYSMMGVSVEDLCKIAMMTAGRFSRGEIVDYADKSPAEQMKAAVHSFKKGSPKGYEPHWPEHAVLASILVFLPHEITAEVAQDDDYNRIMIYTATGDSSHLRNMQDGKRLDKIMGSDLGL